MTIWLEPVDVAAVSQIRDTSGNDALEAATAAARAFVERVRKDLFTGQETEPFAAGDDVKHGAAMLAARLYERRGSLLGVAPSAGYDEAASVVGVDPDIERLLGIGRARAFGFGSAPSS